MIGQRLVTLSPWMLAALFALLVTAHRPAQARTEKVLYNFGSSINLGVNPVGNLIFDKNGNLYGTTSAGGNSDGGTVFELTSAGEEIVLYNFLDHDGDGFLPLAGLVFDKMGNLYGTNSAGGYGGAGAVFKLTPTTGTEKVLYSFGGQLTDGEEPFSNLVLDQSGNLYGTTYEGGIYGYGTVFEVTPVGQEKVLYSFNLSSGDGVYPLAGLVFDNSGNLYGTTSQGGTYNQGAVFELTVTGEEKTLYNFGSQSGDGAQPSAPLVFLGTSLYGTTGSGGAFNSGTVFELTSEGVEKVLYSFGSQSKDGSGPSTGVVFDGEGNLYGTTYNGGAHGWGTLFELTSEGVEKVLHSFRKSGDGKQPDAGLIFDTKGNLYGTTESGGAYTWCPYHGCGTLFKLTK